MDGFNGFSLIWSHPEISGWCSAVHGWWSQVLQLVESDTHCARRFLEVVRDVLSQRDEVMAVRREFFRPMRSGNSAARGPRPVRARHLPQEDVGVIGRV